MSCPVPVGSIRIDEVDIGLGSELFSGVGSAL